MDEDWLEGSPDKVRVDQRQQAIEFARNYEVFRTDSRGAALLKQWDTVYRRRRTPVDSTVQVYAADAAMREFIENIYQQLELAQEQ